MNPSLPVLLSLSVLLTGAALSTGCQSKAPALTRGATASGSIQAAADSITTARGQISLALAALRNVTERPGDVPKQYKTVLEQIAALDASAARIGAAADAMRAKGDDYLAEWAKQIAAIDDADLRNTAFARRAEVAAKLQRIFNGYQKAKADFGPFQASLSDIRRTLAGDLSARGLAAAKPFVEKAAAASEPLKASLDNLAAEFRAVGLSLQPGGAG